jgi:hypothetical protein
MASQRYENGSLTTLMSTELDGLGSGAKALGATAFDNAASGSGFFWADFELNVTFGTAPTAGKVVELYLIPAMDGTNYADGSGTVDPEIGLRAGGVAVRNVNTAQRLVFRNAALPPWKFKPLLKNGADQGFAASGNTLSIGPFRTQVG